MRVKKFSKIQEVTQQSSDFQLKTKRIDKQIEYDYKYFMTSKYKPTQQEELTMIIEKVK